MSNTQNQNIIIPTTKVDRDLITLEQSTRAISSTIDDYYAANPISQWIENYKKARDLDYIQQKINNTQNIIYSKNNTNIKQNSEVKAFKNQYSSEILNVYELIDRNNTSNPAPVNPYLVFANGGCVQVDTNDTGDIGLSIGMCNAANPNQHFSKVKNRSVDSSSHYPGVYQLIPRSSQQPNMCLEFDKSGLSVQPCDDSYYKKGQNFAPLYNNIRYQ